MIYLGFIFKNNQELQVSIKGISSIPYTASHPLALP